MANREEYQEQRHTLPKRVTRKEEERCAGFQSGPLRLSGRPWMQASACSAPGCWQNIDGDCPISIGMSGHEKPKAKRNLGEEELELPVTVAVWEERI